MATTVKVPIARTSPPQYASMERGATVGATVGVNLYWPDGTLVSTDQLQVAASPSGSDANGGNSFTNWSFLQEVPDNVSALADTASIGLYVITGTGTSATRTLVVSSDLTLSDASGIAGNPTLGLADLADAGAGAGLVKITRDSKGRVSGTGAANTDDLAEGSSLYFTEARVRATPLTGLSTATATTVAATDTVLVGVGKLQAQATANATAVSGKEPSITAGTTSQYWRGDKSWRDFATDVRATVLTGLSTATSAVIAATDTVLGALGKLQAQINDNLLPVGYIDGLQMQWVSSTALTVGSGAAYIQGSSKVLRATSAMAKTGLSLSASTWYHVYLYSNSGTPDLEIVTTAPATAYNGAARSKTGDTSRRYVGSVRTDSSGNLLEFTHAPRSGLIVYPVQSGATPFRVVSNGLSTTAVTFSVAGPCPITATNAQARILNLGTGGQAYISTPDFGTVSSSNYCVTAPVSSQSYGPMPIGSGQLLNYVFNLSPGTSGLFVDVIGYLYER